MVGHTPALKPSAWERDTMATSHIPLTKACSLPRIHFTLKKKNPINNMELELMIHMLKCLRGKWMGSRSTEMDRVMDGWREMGGPR